jgi:hypothetical protein
MAPPRQSPSFLRFCEKREQTMKIYVAFGTNRVHIAARLAIMSSRSGAAVMGMCQPLFSMDSDQWLCN